MLHALIMAGGAGTRFWPASRQSLPKQLLEFSGGRTLIQSTVDRLQGLVPPERILILTNEQLVDAVREQLPELPPEAILGEPCKRDTAPCVGLAAEWTLATDPDATLAVLPADHVIAPTARFQAAIRAGVELVAQSPRRFVVYGIRPTYPAESFGYIERGEPIEAPGGAAAFQVVRFREKPKAPQAEEFLATGRFDWNAGIFIWRADAIREAIRGRRPQMAEQLAKIGAAHGRPEFLDVFRREFAAIEGTSIDYAVMEDYPDVVVLEAPFDWDDLGNWRSLARLHGEDSQGNTIVGRHLGIDTSGSIVHTDNRHLVVTVGLRDCIIVHTPDATLVANKHDEESLRQVVKLLEERGWTEYL